MDKAANNIAHSKKDFFFPLTKSWKDVRCHFNQSFQYGSLLGIKSLLEP